MTPQLDQMTSKDHKTQWKVSGVQGWMMTVLNHENFLERIPSAYLENNS